MLRASPPLFVFLSLATPDMERVTIVRWLLTAALVLVFGYFGIDKFLSPILWIGWIPPWMDGLLGLSREVWLKGVGIAEIVVAILLLVPHRRVRQAGAALAVVQLLGVLTQVGWNDVGARDAGLLLASVALFLLI